MFKTKLYFTFAHGSCAESLNYENSLDKNSDIEGNYIILRYMTYWFFPLVSLFLIQLNKI